MVTIWRGPTPTVAPCEAGRQNHGRNSWQVVVQIKPNTGSLLKTNLGGGFKYFLFSSPFGKMLQFD